VDHRPLDHFFGFLLVYRDEGLVFNAWHLKSVFDDFSGFDRVGEGLVAEIFNMVGTRSLEGFGIFV